MRHRSIITAVLVSGALAAVPSAASAQDLRSPDARDQSRQAPAGADLRSPDARVVGDGAAAPAAANRRGADVTDLWGSPIGRVYADTVVAPEDSPVAAPAVIAEPDGFDVRDAFVGALAALGLAGAGVVLTGVRRRRVTAAIGG
jgi:hypothetical protein